jgi:sulfatase maturation enzyme AslB (radical SAM superfamily)
LLLLKQNVHINVGVNYHNHNHLFNLYLFLKSLGINSIHFTIPREVKDCESLMLNKSGGIVPFYLKTAVEIKKIFEYDEKNNIWTTLSYLFV